MKFERGKRGIGIVVQRLQFRFDDPPARGVTDQDVDADEQPDSVRFDDRGGDLHERPAIGWAGLLGDPLPDRREDARFGLVVGGREISGSDAVGRDRIERPQTSVGCRNTAQQRMTFDHRIERPLITFQIQVDAVVLEVEVARDVAPLVSAVASDPVRVLNPRHVERSVGSQGLRQRRNCVCRAVRGIAWRGYLCSVDALRELGQRRSGQKVPEAEFDAEILPYGVEHSGTQQ